MLLFSMECIHVHNCFKCEETFENKPQIRVHFIAMNCDLKLGHDHMQSCRSHSTVIALCVERALDPSTPSLFTRGPVGLLTVLILNTPLLPRWT